MPIVGQKISQKCTKPRLRIYNSNYSFRRDRGSFSQRHRFSHPRRHSGPGFGSFGLEVLQDKQETTRVQAGTFLDIIVKVKYPWDSIGLFNFSAHNKALFVSPLQGQGIEGHIFQLSKNEVLEIGCPLPLGDVPRHTTTPCTAEPTHLQKGTLELISSAQLSHQIHEICRCSTAALPINCCHMKN